MTIGHQWGTVLFCFVFLNWINEYKADGYGNIICFPLTYTYYITCPFPVKQVYFFPHVWVLYAFLYRPHLNVQFGSHISINWKYLSDWMIWLHSTFTVFKGCIILFGVSFILFFVSVRYLIVNGLRQQQLPFALAGCDLTDFKFRLIKTESTGWDCWMTQHQMFSAKHCHFLVMSCFAFVRNQ